MMSHETTAFLSAKQTNNTLKTYLTHICPLMLINSIQPLVVKASGITLSAVLLEMKQLIE